MISNSARNLISDRGLSIWGANNAERAALFEATGNFIGISRTSIGGVSPEVVISVPQVLQRMKIITQFSISP
jgi:hypothetical protein